MSERPEPISEERTVFEGNIIEIVRQDMDLGGEEVPFEWARRAPGVRLIVDNGEEILLTEEYRNELNGVDCRLPGGKVFDSLTAYNSFLDSDEEIDGYARKAAKAEAREEAGVEAESVEFFKKNHSGATVEWDLHYFVVKDFETTQQDLEKGEDIDYSWHSYDQAREKCIEGEIREDRTAAVILQYLERRSKV